MIQQSLSIPAAEERFIKGEIVKVRYRNPDNAYSVLLLRTPSRQEVTVVGHTMAVEHEMIAAEGEWQTHEKYGLQFHASQITFAAPSNKESIVKVLSSGVIPGIGEGIAKRIVEHFGLETFAVIEDNPQRLREIKGIGEAKCRAITQHWANHRIASRAMTYLSSYGISIGVAVRAYRRFGGDLGHIVRDMPYRLCEVSGISFAIADRIAKQSGKIDTMARVSAALQHAVHRSVDEGNVGATHEECRRAVARLLEPDHPHPDIDDDTWQKVLSQSHQGIVIDDTHVWEGGLHQMEQTIADSLAARIHSPPLLSRVSPATWRHALDLAERQTSTRLTKEQRQAILNAAEHPVSIVTGGPGTGKTTLLKVLLRAASSCHLTVTLTAPTGKAAKRMEEVTGHEAHTIAKATGQMTGSPNVIASDLWVIDETSMVDLHTLRVILHSASPSTTLIFIGDANQLPSIGPGAVLRDLIESEVIPVTTLSNVFRQADRSPIITAAHEVLNGEILRETNRHGLIVRYVDDLHKIRDLVLRASTKAKNPQSVQVLTPMRKGTLGVEALNPAIQSCLIKDPSNPFTVGERRFHVGDRVIHLKNNYDIEVMNGEVGDVTEVSAKHMTVHYGDDHEVDYTAAIIDQVAHAYALTVHKSQGSQYPVVVIPITSEHRMMLCRPVLYTALTRAIDWCVIYAQRQAMLALQRYPRMKPRHTRLAERLRDAARRSAQ